MMTQKFLNPLALRDCSTCWFAATLSLGGDSIFQCTYSGKIHTSLIGLHRSCSVESVALKERLAKWNEPEPAAE